MVFVLVFCKFKIFFWTETGKEWEVDVGRIPAFSLTSDGSDVFILFHRNNLDGSRTDILRLDLWRMWRDTDRICALVMLI